MRRYRNRERNYIETKLSKYLPVIIEANLMAVELKRNILFKAKLKYVYAEQFDFLMDFNEEDAERGQL
jgi:hypothetical protein